MILLNIWLKNYTNCISNNEKKKNNNIGKTRTANESDFQYFPKYFAVVFGEFWNHSYTSVRIFIIFYRNFLVVRTSTQWYCFYFVAARFTKYPSTELWHWKQLIARRRKKRDFDVTFGRHFYLRIGFQKLNVRNSVRSLSKPHTRGETCRYIYARYRTIISVDSKTARRI